MSLAKVELNDIGTLANPASARQALNDNFKKIEDEFEKVLHRDGSVPNSMEADLDMNSNRILNVADGKADLDAVNKRQMDSTIRKEVLDQVMTAVTNPNTELFLQDGDGAVPRTIAQKLREIRSVLDFGAAGDGVTDDTAAIQKAMDATAGKARLHIPAGVYMISAPLQFKSHVYVFGDGMDNTIIRFASTVTEEHNMLQPVAFDMSVGHAYFEGFTLDGNRDARVSSGAVTGRGDIRPGGSGWASMSAHDCVLYRVRSINQVLHGFDDCAGGDLNNDGRRRYVFPAGRTVYSTTPSRNNRYIECEASNWGDDGFTAHYSEGGRFIRCRAVDASTWEHATGTAMCGFEIDDGCIDYVVEGCYVENSSHGINAKGHDDAPAASIVRIRNNEIVGCVTGVMVYNAYYDAETDPGADIIAYDYVVENNVVRDPRPEMWPSINAYGFYARNVSNARFSNNTARANGDETGLSAAFYFRAVRGGVVDGYFAQNWPGLNSATGDQNSPGLRVNGSDITIGHGQIINPGLFGAYVSNTGGDSYPKDVGPLLIVGSGESGSVGYMTSGTLQSGKLNVTVTGFDTPVVESTSTAHPQPLQTTGNAGLRVAGWIVGGRATGVPDSHEFRSLTAGAGDDIASYSQSTGGISVRIRSRGGGGAGYSGTASIMHVATMETTGRSINAGGTINASGADYAEYFEVQEHLIGAVPKGAILGLDANGRLTDKFAEAVGGFLVKSTSPNLVGNDGWGTEEAICAKYGIEPVGEKPELVLPDAPEDDAPEDAHAVWAAECEQARSAHAEAVAAWEHRRAQFEATLESERRRWDRMALCGQVPVNVLATPADVGKFLVAVELEDGRIGGEWRERGSVGDAEVIGRLIRIEDGRSIVLVR